MNLKLTMPYMQTTFDFLVPNNGKLVDGLTRKYANSWTMDINIPRIKQNLFNIFDRKIYAFYCEVPVIGYSYTVKLINNYDMHVIFDMAATTAT